jgi:hypothetical protein
MYDVLPSFVLGFHGCDRAVAEKVFGGRTTLKASQNDYDWLGNGVYFWENNPQRAMDYAALLKQYPRGSEKRVTRPAVVGAVIDLGLCLNLLDAQFIKMMKSSYENLQALHRQAGTNLPSNRPLGGSKELLLRRLDCAVIETLHSIRRDRGLTPFDSARGVFVEGEPIYPGAGVHEFNHIQICVRNPSCIKGYFRVLQDAGGVTRRTVS